MVRSLIRIAPGVAYLGFKIKFSATYSQVELERKLARGREARADVSGRTTSTKNGFARRSEQDKHMRCTISFPSACPVGESPRTWTRGTEIPLPSFLLRWPASDRREKQGPLALGGKRERGGSMARCRVLECTHCARLPRNKCIACTASRKQKLRTSTHEAISLKNNCQWTIENCL